MRRRRIVAIELEMCRSGRIGARPATDLPEFATAPVILPSERQLARLVEQQLVYEELREDKPARAAQREMPHRKR